MFGESGSGKTVMLSSFYGATQERSFWDTSLVDVTALDTGQGHRLLANYVGMRDDGRRPAANRSGPGPGMDILDKPRCSFLPVIALRRNNTKRSTTKAICMPPPGTVFK